MMASKLTPHQNILQPKRLNSAEVGRVQNPKGVQRPDGPTLTLNGVTIGLSPTVHHVGGLGLGPFSNNSSMNISNQNNTTPAKKGSTTMAKRNARERNRVKQVNQGFQTLRQHIPDSYRMKKMSKVDTLRCALDYIRSMEQILEISPKLFPSREPMYHGFTGGDMNQHLDKICSMEETYGESMSLDQSFSSFSESEESPSHDLNNDPDQGSGCLNSSSENHFPGSLQQQHQHQHQLHPHHQQDQSIEIVTSSEGNNGSFESLVGSSPSSHTTSNSTSSAPSNLLPAQLHSHPNNMKIENSMEMIPSDENYNPPSNGPFIRVVEIIQLQQ